MPRIISISDTHEQHDDVIVPDGDILIHSGDWTYAGKLDAIEKFLIWFVAQPQKYKIFCAGNHELGLDSGLRRKEKLDLILSYTNKNTHYLENSGVNIEGINFYGSPASPFFHDWAFNYNRGEEIAAIWKLIPDSTNFLITHGPPYAILDEAPINRRRMVEGKISVGCKDLLNRIYELKELKVHQFGHIHNERNVVNKNGITFINASICDNDCNPTNKPIVIDL
jgi:Icc-related predicted phosphoesterase